MAARALVRFGIRKPQGQVTLLLSTLGLAACLLLWLPSARPWLLLSVAPALTFCLSDAPPRRRAFCGAHGRDPSNDGYAYLVMILGSPFRPALRPLVTC